MKEYRILFSVVKERVVEANSEEEAIEAVECDWEGADQEGGFEIIEVDES